MFLSYGVTFHLDDRGNGSLWLFGWARVRMSIPGEVHLWDARSPRRGVPHITAGQEASIGAGTGDGNARCSAQRKATDTATISLKQTSRKSGSHG